MTNENKSVGSVVVSVNAMTKHTLRSDNNTNNPATVDSVMMHEEDKMIDEEVTSVESGAADEEEVERTMLTVALMKSVVDQSHLKESSTVAGSVEKKQPGESVDSAEAASNRPATIALNTDPSDTLPVPGEALKGDSGDQTQHVRKRRRPTGGNENTEQAQQQPGERLAVARTSATKVAPLPGISQPPVGANNNNNNKNILSTITIGTQVASIPTPTLSGQFVPNPLSKSIPSNCTKSNVPVASVPCPLPALSLAPPVASVATTVNASTNNNNTVDTTKQPTLVTTDSKRKVNFEEPSETSRMRGFSIDLDLGLEFPDDASNSGAEGSDAPAGGRHRGFSFECFAFGISADEPLPPLDQSASSANVTTFVKQDGSRPRGDSIIFDPVSFQEGGILEQHALLEPACRIASTDTVSKATAQPQQPLPITTAPRAPVPAQARSGGTSVSLPASTAVVASAAGGGGVCQNNHAPSLSSTTTTTLSMELLNKDGRIGIYLPEARKARIERFHAKRSKRIWRKRIKYDCRKKLADSRPRIKGRFVKRSEMDTF